MRPIRLQSENSVMFKVMKPYHYSERKYRVIKAPRSNLLRVILTVSNLIHPRLATRQFVEIILLMRSNLCHLSADVVKLCLYWGPS